MRISNKNLPEYIITLGALIFAGVFFREFRVFFGSFGEIKYPRNISRC